jgi:hypothetical protein
MISDFLGVQDETALIGNRLFVKGLTNAKRRPAGLRMPPKGMLTRTCFCGLIITLPLCRLSQILAHTTPDFAKSAGPGVFRSERSFGQDRLL